MPIDEASYLQLVSAYKGDNLLGDLPDQLVPLWWDAYAATNPVAKLVEVPLTQPGGPSSSYLFDLTLRDVVAWGTPAYVTHERDASRMSGHSLGGDSRYHRGHLMSHGTGGNRHQPGTATR